MKKLDAELIPHGKAPEFRSYPAANHAFMNHAATGTTPKPTAIPGRRC